MPWLAGLKMGWEKDTGQGIPDDSRKNLIAYWHSYSHEAQSQLIIYKIINKSFWTPCKLLKLKGDVVRRRGLLFPYYIFVKKQRICGKRLYIS